MSQVLAPDIPPQEEEAIQERVRLHDAENKIEELSGLCATQDQEVSFRCPKQDVQYLEGHLFTRIVCSTWTVSRSIRLM